MSIFKRKPKYPDDAVILYVGGMHCAHCVARVTEALSALPGVAAAEVSLDAGTAAVTETKAGAADVNAMLAAVRALGFTAEKK